MTLDMYLSFDGNCREVFDFYRQVFGGEFRTMMTFGEAPPGVEIPQAEKDRIMHVALPIGSSTLMGSDSCSAFGAASPGRKQLLYIHLLIQQGGDRRPVREAVPGRGGGDASPGYVLGGLLRFMHRQARHQVADQPPDCVLAYFCAKLQALVAGSLLKAGSFTLSEALTAPEVAAGHPCNDHEQRIDERPQN